MRRLIPPNKGNGVHTGNGDNNLVADGGTRQLITGLGQMAVLITGGLC